jgi:hypothetical protein
MLLKHLINLFECTILGFGNEEEEEDEADQVRSKPDITVFGSLMRVSMKDDEEGVHTQLRAVGLRKYGAVKTTSQFQKKPTPMVMPRVYDRRRWVGISPAAR